MSVFWDQRYRESNFAYGTRPNEFFAVQIEKLKPKKMLLPAEGEGRNAVYAASKGWQVDAFDFSPVAKKHAIQLAHQHEVSINYFLADFKYLLLPENTYHLIALIFTHMPSYLRRKVFHTMVRSLKPKGMIIAELFTPNQLNYQSGGPKNPDYLITPEILKQDFADLSIKQNQEKNIILDEGPYHQGEASVVQFLAKK